MRLLFAALAATLLAGVALAHESWISKGGYRNAGGEWCCGHGDCFVIPAEQVELKYDGYHLALDRRLYPKGDEIVPHVEAQASPDGQYWRCKRPDGSRRCFFAPPPST